MKTVRASLPCTKTKKLKTETSVLCISVREVKSHSDKILSFFVQLESNEKCNFQAGCGLILYKIIRSFFSAQMGMFSIFIENKILLPL